MNRKEKIKFLQDLSEGRRVMKDQFPPLIFRWQQDAVDPEIFRCGELTIRRGQPLPESKTRNVLNIFGYYCAIEIKNYED
jgi:hypothetical protein